jgi:hypothetical protein
MKTSIFRALNDSPTIKVFTGATSIGTGTVRDYAMPIYGEFRPQTLSANLYDRAELSKDFAGEKYMVGMELNLYEYVADYQFDFVQIALGHISESEFPDPFTPDMELEIKDLTWVHKQEPFILNKGGGGETQTYFDFTSEEMFVYNGEDNLLVIFIGGFYENVKDKMDEADTIGVITPVEPPKPVEPVEPNPVSGFPKDYGYVFSSPTYRRASLVTQSVGGDVELEPWFAVRQLLMNATFYHYRYAPRAKADEILLRSKMSLDSKFTIRQLMEEVVNNQR